ncbi:MAG TPA: hypothetical protein VNC85_12210 [Mycobacteriales bacterium]|nr:hypothetical protein [Mycobacteriales bacterium]
MTSRRRTTLPAIVVAGALLAAGCTGGKAPAGSAEPSVAETPAPAAALVRPPTAATAVAAGRTPGEITAAVSRSLFASAPAAVVALASDPAAVSAGAAEAERRGVPMLLDDGSGAKPAAGGTTTPSAAPDGTAAPVASDTPAAPEGTGVPDGTAAPGSDPAGIEVTRLKPASVLALGPGVADRLASTGANVVTNTAQLPEVGRPEAATGTTVLVDPTVKATAVAVTTTGEAAGARVVPVAGTDPRADSAAIAALAQDKPEHVVAAGTAFGPTSRLAARVATAATGIQLPGGGQVVLPGRRLVAMYGHPGTAGLGVLGEQPLPQAIARAKQLAVPYRALSGSTPVVPTFELIATVAQANPGVGGDYSYEAPVSLLKPWVVEAGKAGMYVVLDLQPGRSNFLDQAKLYEPLLRLPHVGLALDPEWRLRPDQLPLTEIGSAKASEINSVYSWLADLTDRLRLPQKLFVIHQFRLSMIGDDQPLEHDRDSVQLLIHMDGQGPTGNKDETWAAVVGAAPKGVPFGWKNFYDEDTPVLTPAQTMSRKPTPSMISYQ